MAKPKLTPDELVEEVLLHLADRPEDVQITSNVSEHSASFDIEVHDSDVGKVLGKRGAHPKALRVIFGAIYGKHGKRLHLQVIDPRRR